MNDSNVAGAHEESSAVRRDDRKDLLDVLRVCLGVDGISVYDYVTLHGTTFI